MQRLLSHLLLIFSISVKHGDGQQPNDSHCLPDWQFSNQTSFCYWLSPMAMTWAESQSYCDSLGGYLADISNSNEVPELSRLFGRPLLAPWMGGYKNETSGQWQFLNGASIYSSYWTTDEPSLYGTRTTLVVVGKTGVKATPDYSIQPALCKEKPALCNGGSFGGSNVASGNITSPGWPVQYYNNLDCIYVIIGPTNTYITIFFDPYLVEDYVDWVEIFNGNSTNSRDRIGEIDEKNTWEVSFESRTNVMTVKFHTDATKTDRGWFAKWAAKYNVPPIYANGSRGELSSPNYPNDYDPFTQQLYYIDVVSPLNINITFDAFNLQLQADYLEIFSSRSMTAANLVANLTGSTNAGKSYVVPSSTASMRFITDGEVQRPGWHLAWNAF